MRGIARNHVFRYQEGKIKNVHGQQQMRAVAVVGVTMVGHFRQTIVALPVGSIICRGRGIAESVV